MTSKSWNPFGRLDLEIYIRDESFVPRRPISYIYSLSNTLLCFNPFTLRVTLKSIVCYSHTFKNNLGIKRKIMKYLKKSCYLASDQHFFFKCVPTNASVSKIFHKSSGLFWPF